MKNQAEINAEIKNALKAMKRKDDAKSRAFKKYTTLCSKHADEAPADCDACNLEGERNELIEALWEAQDTIKLLEADTKAWEEADKYMGVTERRFAKLVEAILMGAQPNKQWAKFAQATLKRIGHY